MKTQHSLKGLLLVVSLTATINSHAFPWEENVKNPRIVQLENVASPNEVEVKVVLLKQVEVDVCLEESVTTKELKNCLNTVLSEKAED